MSVIAFLDQETCKVYGDLSEVPQGALVFSTPEELAKVASMESMDHIRGKLMCCSIGKSSTKQEAAQRLWYVLMLGVPGEMGEEKRFGPRPKARDAFGNLKISDTSAIELIQLLYVPGADYMADHFYKKLPTQAKKLIQFLVDDGRGLWTNEDANAVVAAREAEIPTKQGIQRVFSYYKPELFAKKMLRRLTYEEFLAKPEFSGIQIATGDPKFSDHDELPA